MKGRTRVLIGAGVVVVLVSGGGSIALAAQGDPASRYRLATAAMDTIEQRLTIDGTIASAARDDAAYSVAGTVASVDVAVGDKVRAGQQLSSLDPADLQEALDAAKEALQDAQDALDQDLESQTTGTGASELKVSGGGVGSMGVAQIVPAELSDAAQQAIQAVTDAQNALLAQYEATSQAIAAATSAANAASSACGAFNGDSLPDSWDGVSDVLTPIKGNLATCQQAVQAATAAQEAAAAQQDVLKQRADALNQAVTAARDALAASGGSGCPVNPQPAQCPTDGGGAGQQPQQSAGDQSGGSSLQGGNATAGGSNSTLGGSGGSSSGAASAEQVLADRANVDLAAAKVAVAEQNLALAVLRSPIDGTVAAIGLAVGEQVSAGSSTQVITVIGDDGFVITATVPLAKIDLVRVGQEVNVTLPGSTETADGTVSRIDPVNATSDGSGTPTYQVTVALGDKGAPAVNGASAQLDVIVGTTDRTLTVPTSAVHRSGGTYTVTQFVDGGPLVREVSVGAVGAELTEITDGLAQGDSVILADLDQEMGGGSDNSATSLTSLTNQGSVSFPAGGPNVIPGSAPMQFTKPG